MKYFGYLLKRIGYSLIVLLGLSIIIFFISRVLPGDPARMALGPYASKDQVEVLRQSMGLDKPLFIQYFTYITSLFKGDFGMSMITKRNVLIDLKYHLPATLELISFTILWVIFLGIPLGVITAAKKDSTLDNIFKTFSFAAVVTPGFIVGLAFQLIFGYGLDILPITGRLSSALTAPSGYTGLIVFDSLISGQWEIFFNALRHILLPSLALSMAGIGQVSRITRASMIEISEKDYVEVMHSYGVPNQIINFVYMLKPSFIPSLNVIGMTFASLLGNAFLIEMVFAWPGIAKYGINALLRTDINALMGVVLLIGAFFLLTNFVVDIIMGLIDPRISKMGGE
ncbi:MAG: ABC transporter permease [Bacillota bacterium]